MLDFKGKLRLAAQTILGTNDPLSVLMLEVIMNLGAYIYLTECSPPEEQETVQQNFWNQWAQLCKETYNTSNGIFNNCNFNLSSVDICTSC